MAHQRPRQRQRRGQGEREREHMSLATFSLPLPPLFSFLAYPRGADKVGARGARSSLGCGGRQRPCEAQRHDASEQGARNEKERGGRNGSAADWWSCFPSRARAAALRRRRIRRYEEAAVAVAAAVSEEQGAVCCRLSQSLSLFDDYYFPSRRTGARERKERRQKRAPATRRGAPWAGSMSSARDAGDAEAQTLTGEQMQRKSLQRCESQASHAAPSPPVSLSPQRVSQPSSLPAGGRQRCPSSVEERRRRVRESPPWRRIPSRLCVLSERALGFLQSGARRRLGCGLGNGRAEG